MAALGEVKPLDGGDEPISAGAKGTEVSTVESLSTVEVVDVVEVVVEAVVVVIIGVEAGYASATRINSGQRL